MDLLDLLIAPAHAQAAPAAGGGSMLSTLLFPIILIGIMYFLMIRPQMKRQKEHRAMIEALAKGDEVATAGGMLGRVTRLGEQFIGVEVANGVEVQVQRQSVVQVLPKGTIK